MCVLVALVALKEMIFAEVGEDVRALLRHQHARIFRIGEVDFGNLFGVALAVGVEVAHQALIDAPCAPGAMQACRRDQCR